MHRAKILMPALVLALIFGFASAAQAEVACQVSVTPISRATATGHTEPIGDVTLTCSSSNGNAVSSATITLEYVGIDITNNLTTPAAADINVIVTGNGAFTGIAATPLINNSAGQILVSLPAVDPAAADEDLTITVEGVLGSLDGTGLSSVNVNVSTTQGYTIVAGQNQATAVNSVLAGLEDPDVPGFGAGNPEIVFTNGVFVDTAVQTLFTIEEGYVDMFRSAAQFNDGESTNGVEIELIFGGLFDDIRLDDCVAVADSGTATITPTRITDTDNTATVAFTVGPDLTDVDEIDINCDTELVGLSPTLPLPAGDITVQIGLAPTGDDLSSPGSNVIDGDVPRYEQDRSDAVTIVRIVPAVTNLLIPFASASGGFNTGIAIANTSADPYGNDGAEPVGGTVTFTFYPQEGDSFSYTTDASSPGTGLDSDGELAAGGSYVVLLTELLEAAGESTTFAGYIFIETNFTNAHGQAFVTDFIGFTSAADVLVVDASNRPTEDEGLNK